MTEIAQLNAALAGRYALERELGAGGMATVYLARDEKHERKVALKVLRPELAAVIGAQRFLAEIKTTANLQHPHILALFDSGEIDGTVFYVMPYVQGESLRDRLEREKQLPVDDALRIAREVASALDYAHRHGVIHRDIKPENILLHDGQALVADFGIALAVAKTGATRMTETGMSLGTPTYMSPEQAMGERTLDARTDLYALGCVLFEMLAGEPPFTGPTAQAIVAKVMTDEARPLTQLRKTVAPHVEAAVRRALQKLPADRFASAREFSEALARADTTIATPMGAGADRRRARTVAAMTIGVILVASAAGWYARGLVKGATESEPEPSRLALMTPEIGGSGSGQLNRYIGLTRDGSAVLYVVAEAGMGPLRGLIMHRLEDETPRAIPNSGLLYAPSVSPDGRWIAGRASAGDLIRFPMNGSDRRPVPLARGYAYYAWHPDGTLWVTRAPYRIVERLRPGADTLETVYPVGNGVWIQQVLDDGRSALVIVGAMGTASGLCALMDLGTGRLTPLLDIQVIAARYARGYIVFARPDGTLLAAPLDAAKARVTGPPVPLATGVGVTGSGDAQFDVARNGTLVYVPETPRSLVMVDRAGMERALTDEVRSFHMPRFSPDGRRLSVDFVTTGEGRDVWLYDFDQKTLTRTTFARDGHDASWAPDGKSLLFTSTASDTFGIYRMRPGGGTPAEPLIVSPSLSFTGEWLADGSGFVTVGNDLSGRSGQDIVIVRDQRIEPLVATPFGELYPSVTRDGRWLAYVSDESGKMEVYVRPLAGGGEVRQISQGGGDEPLWSRDGRELFYRSYAESEVKLVAATMETTPALRVAKRTVLFPLADYVNTRPHTSYDVSPDGRSFVFVRRNPASRAVVIQHFPELARRLAGARGQAP